MIGCKMDTSLLKRSTRSVASQKLDTQSTSGSSADTSSCASSSAATSGSPSPLPSAGTSDPKSKASSFFRLLIDEASSMPMHDFQLSPSFLQRNQSESHTRLIDFSSPHPIEVVHSTQVHSPQAHCSQAHCPQAHCPQEHSTQTPSSESPDQCQVNDLRAINMALNKKARQYPQTCGQLVKRPSSSCTQTKNQSTKKAYMLQAHLSADSNDSSRSTSGPYCPKIAKLTPANHKSIGLLPIQVNALDLKIKTEQSEQRLHLNEIHCDSNLCDNSPPAIHRVEPICSALDSDRIAKLLHQDLDSKFNVLKAANRDRIVKLYALPGRHVLPASSDQTEIEILILVQHHFVNIWFKIEKSDWKSCVLSCKKNEKIFTTELVRFADMICLFCLATNMKSVFLKYCKIDLIAQNASFLSIETFANISFDEFDFINMSQVADDKIAITIPRLKSAKIDLYMYQLVVDQCNLKNLKKSLLFTCEMSAKCRNNYLFRIAELPNTFISILQDVLYLWDITPGNQQHKILSLEKYASPSNIYFDSFYDRGIFYLLYGNKYTAQVKVLAINADREQISKLESYDLNDITMVKEPEDRDFLTSTYGMEIKMLKRSNDLLIVIKQDSNLILYDLINKELVFGQKLNNLYDACIGFLNKNAVIFAACGRQAIINLLN